ncbi:restriction endonuclease [Cysteiniphilum marinum]|uniref:restriction endonuclease n=1 Tax=Cysteiniphilum marinum TaxID=2774191 RepID=UPI001F22B9FB|nr:restriction endonuclease [Cysteiniphilum marinum]
METGDVEVYVMIAINEILTKKPNSKISHSLKRFMAKAIENAWLNFVVRKSKHSHNIRQARKVMKLLNKDEFRASAPKFYSYVRKIDPLVFEELLLYCFAVRGFSIKRNSRYTGDGGVDGMVKLGVNKNVSNSGAWWLIQAKRYQNHINPQHVNDFKRVIDQAPCASGLFIHTGKTGDKSYQYLGAYQYKLQLISGANLHQLICYALAK